MSLSPRRAPFLTGDEGSAGTPNPSGSVPSTFLGTTGPLRVALALVVVVMCVPMMV